MKIAIMQPYFIPYAGYFRLFAAADLFVVYDDVQFNRRGWVHRNKLTAYSGRQEWMTLPIKKTERDTTRIMDLEWAAGAHQSLVDQSKKFPGINVSGFSTKIKPYKFILKSMQGVCAELRLPFNIAYASELGLDQRVKGQNRILALCNHFKASHYINTPGGRALYSEETFADNGIKLEFLPSYNGSYNSILDRLNGGENPSDIRLEVMRNL